MFFFYYGLIASFKLKQAWHMGIIKTFLIARKHIYDAQRM